MGISSAHEFHISFKTDMIPKEKLNKLTKLDKHVNKCASYK